MSCGISIRAVVLSSFALDGGAMHGIVPRLLWQRIHPPDDHHRIALCARAIIVDHDRTGSRTLIELGMGQRWSSKERRIYALSPGPDVPGVLREQGVDPDTITHVILTHLHWDHAGGVVLSEPDHAALAFPKAEHIVGEACLTHAQSPSEKDSGSFRPDDIEWLLREGNVRRWQVGQALAPGIEGRLSNGHTEGLIIPLIAQRDDGPPVAMPTDLIPTRSHLKPHWVMAYDNQPTTTVIEKRALMDDLMKIGGGVVLYHDPMVEAAWVVMGKKGAEFVVGGLDGSRRIIESEG